MVRVGLRLHRVGVVKVGHELLCMKLRKIIIGAVSIASAGVMATAAQPEGWKRGGLLKGAGIPAPSGRYAVGCVDFMHQVGYPCHECPAW